MARPDAAVYILLGQSNAVGHGVPMTEEDKITVPMRNVFGLHRADNQSYEVEKLTWRGYLSAGMNLAETQDDFEFFVDLLWKAYNTMRTRVPMTDWYFTDTSEMRGFQHRTVQGGLFLKLLFE